MIKIKDIRMKPKLITLFLCIGIVPLSIVGWWSCQLSQKALMKKAFEQLEAVREIKKAQIESYFSERKGDLSVLMETVDTLRSESLAKLIAVREIKKNQIEQFFKDRFGDITALSQSRDVIAVFDQLEAYQRAQEIQSTSPFDVKSDAFQQLYAKNSAFLSNYAKIYEYYDIFLINAKYGQVMFTVARENDLGTNLKQGPYKDSGLAKVWEAVVTTNNAAIQDFEPYAPSNNAPAGFIGAPIRSATGETKGVLVFQLSIDAINRVMAQRQGLGQTGETYLVGPDKLMRSDSFLDPVHHTVMTSFKNPEKGKVDTAAVKNALGGQKGAHVIIDYNNNYVLSAYTPLKVGPPDLGPHCRNRPKRGQGTDSYPHQMDRRNCGNHHSDRSAHCLFYCQRNCHVIGAKCGSGQCRGHRRPFPKH